MSSCSLRKFANKVSRRWKRRFASGDPCTPVHALRWLLKSRWAFQGRSLLYMYNISAQILRRGGTRGEHATYQRLPSRVQIEASLDPRRNDIPDASQPHVEVWAFKAPHTSWWPRWFHWSPQFKYYVECMHTQYKCSVSNSTNNNSSSGTWLCLIFVFLVSEEHAVESCEEIAVRTVEKHWKKRGLPKQANVSSRLWVFVRKYNLGSDWQTGVDRC